MNKKSFIAVGKIAAFFILLALIQISFIQVLPSPFHMINLPLAAILFTALDEHLRFAILFAFIFGYIEGLYSLASPSIHIIKYLGLVIFLKFLFTSVLPTYKFLSIFTAGSLTLFGNYFFLYGLSYILSFLKRKNFFFEPLNIRELALLYFLNIALITLVYAAKRNTLKNRWISG